MKRTVYLLKTSTCGKCPFIIKQAEKIVGGLNDVELSIVDLTDGSDTASEFINKYNVKNVPKFVVDDKLVEGTIPAFKSALGL